MKTISLRTLVRETAKVKQITRSGKAVQVTDNGEPLWILQPANGGGDEKERIRATDGVLNEVLLERPSKISAARLLEESRR